MKKGLLLCSLLSLLAFGPAAKCQGLENFNNYPETSNAYHSGTFTGQDGSTWTYTQCRGDSVINAPTPTLGKNRTPPAEVSSGTLHGGCGILSFQYKQVFSSNVALDVYVNGVLLTTVTSSNEAGIVKNSGTIDVDLSGDFVLDFKQSSSAAGQCAVDNIQWTDHSVLPEPTYYPENFSATPSNSKITLSWTDASGGQAPGAYLILGSSSDDIVSPVDGTVLPDDTVLSDGSAALNVIQGVGTCTFNGLPGNTRYYFKIFPYTNSGAFIDYKTDGSPPAADTTTPFPAFIVPRDLNLYSLYPNPSMGQVKLKCNGKGTKLIEMMDVVGNKVFHGTVNGFSMMLDLSSLRKGIYYFRLTDEESLETSVRKLILQ